MQNINKICFAFVYIIGCPSRREFSIRSSVCGLSPMIAGCRYGLARIGDTNALRCERLGFLPDMSTPEIKTASMLRTDGRPDPVLKRRGAQPGDSMVLSRKPPLTPSANDLTVGAQRYGTAAKIMIWPRLKRGAKKLTSRLRLRRQVFVAR